MEWSALDGDECCILFFGRVHGLAKPKTVFKVLNRKNPLFFRLCDVTLFLILFSQFFSIYFIFLKTKIKLHL